MALWLTCRTATSSSSCHVASKELTEPLAWPVSIVHFYREVFRVMPCICIELLYIDYCWSSCICSSIWRGPKEYIAYEFVLTSKAVSHMPALSNLDSFREEWWVAAQLLFCGVLPPGLVQYFPSPNNYFGNGSLRCIVDDLQDCNIIVNNFFFKYESRRGMAKMQKCNIVSKRRWSPSRVTRRFPYQWLLLRGVGKASTPFPE